MAPDVTLVNIRVGQDAGFFFLEPTLKALVYAGNIGVDVVNMSFYIDPWLFNCMDNPADSPAEQAEQRGSWRPPSGRSTTRTTAASPSVAALGNEHRPRQPDRRRHQPRLPGRHRRPASIDNATCLTMPSEANHVISVASVGPSTKKADYSNHGLEQNDVSAPGGWFRDFFGTPKFMTAGNLDAGPHATQRGPGERLRRPHHR